MAISKDEKIKDLLQRGVVEIIHEGHLRQALKGGKKLRVKLGIDPTSPNIHIGRAVLLLKLRAIQDLGHTAIFIVGDFTGLVGDSSDKDSERPMLGSAEIKSNMRTYFQQAYKILDKTKTEVHYNSKWLKKLGFLEITKMAHLFGLHEFEAREVISRRMKAGKRVSFHETMYPLMQGYDSVAVRADVELGGTDQRFNLLAGRVIQGQYRQKPQDILMADILEGTDGRKMSSSWGNVINITDQPGEMFGKIMSIADNLIKKYFLLATAVPQQDIEQSLRLKNPRDQKLALALAVTELYHGREKARQVQQEFLRVHTKKEKPAAIKIMPKVKVADTAELLVRYGLTVSKSEARRLIDQGGVKIDDQMVKNYKTPPNLKSGSVIQVGKRKFVKIK